MIPLLNMVWCQSVPNFTILFTYNTATCCANRLWLLSLGDSTGGTSICTKKERSGPTCATVPLQVCSHSPYNLAQPFSALSSLPGLFGDHMSLPVRYVCQDWGQ